MTATFADGTALTGTRQHPVWCVTRQDWVGLGELLPGEEVETRNGPLALLPHTGVPLERERALSAALIIAPVYGTRASTVLCVARDGAVVWEERSITPEGRVAHTVREQFQLA